METFCWYVLLNKVFVDDICLEVVRASLKNLCELIGSPYNSIFFKKEVRQISICSCKIKGNYFKDKKRKNCNHWKGNTANSFLSKRKPCESILSKLTLVKKSLKETTKSISSIEEPKKTSYPPL